MEGLLCSWQLQPGIMQHPAIRRNTKLATQRLLAKLKECFSMNKSEVVQ